MTETELQRAVIVALQQMGVWVIRTAVSRKRGRGFTGEPGMPDLCLPEYGWLEVKLPDGKLEPDQVTWHDRARRRNINVDTVRSVAQAIDAVKTWRSYKLTIWTPRGRLG